MNKEYIYKGHKFRMKPFNLSFLSASAEVLIKMKKVEHEFTSDIDMSNVRKSEKRLSELRTSIQQTEELINNNKFDSEDKKNESINYLTNQKEKLEEEIKKYQDDFVMQEKIKLFDDCKKYADAEVFTDSELMSKFFKAILIGDVSLLSWVDMDIINFTSEVVEDFFGFIKSAIDK